MWLTKKLVMEDFAAEVKRGKYKKIDYQTWRELKESPGEWDLNLQSYFSASEENPVYATVTWDGWTYPYEFPINDSSFGQYIYDLIGVYDKPIHFDLDTCTISDSFAKCAEVANKMANSWAKNLNGTWKRSTDDKSLNKIIDEATGASINRKENDSMNLFKDFNFGSCENDNVKMSMYGIAVKNATGTWVSYDSKSGNVIDVDILNFSAKYLYKMPVAIKDVAPGDVIIHNRKPMFVTDVSNGKLLVIDPAAGEEKIVLLTKNMFGFDFATKVVNLFGNLSASASEVSPFGNMLPLMMLADGGKSDDILPLMFLTNGGGNFDMSNPMMLYFLMKNGDKSNDMLPLYFFMNGSYLGPNNPKTCNCGDCDCDKTAQ